MKINTPSELRDNLKDKGFSYVEYIKVREFAKLFKAKSITINENSKSIYGRLFKPKGEKDG